MRARADHASVLGTIVGLAVVAAALAACTGARSDADRAASSTTSTAASSSTSGAEATTTTIAAELGCAPAVDGSPSDQGPYAVGRQTLRYVDLTRRTAAPPGSQVRDTAGRAVPVVVLYPADGDPGTGATPAERPITDGARPAAGSFPLVVHSHGVFSSGAERNEVLASWARAGYVVIAPTFPLSSRPSVDGGDLPNQPADVVFATRTFASEVQSPDHPLYGHVRGACLALSGHSLGAATAMAAAFDPCCTSIRPLAVVDISGVLVPVTPGADLSRAEPLPALVVHGARDEVVSIGASEAAIESLRGPRWFLTFEEGGHNSMFEPPEVEVLNDAVVSFLDAQLKGAPDRLAGLRSRVDASGSATLRVLPAQ